MLVSGDLCSATGWRSLSAQAPAPRGTEGRRQAPDFSLPGTDGKTHKLSDYKGKTVVVAWYPAAFTGGCTAECKSFRDSGEAIKKFDVAYFMASVDTPEKNTRVRRTGAGGLPDAVRSRQEGGRRPTAC